MLSMETVSRIIIRSKESIVQANAYLRLTECRVGCFRFRLILRRDVRASCLLRSAETRVPTAQEFFAPLMLSVLGNFGTTRARTTDFPNLSLPRLQMEECIYLLALQRC